MSHLDLDTPRQLQPAVTQRDVEAEIAKCVGGVISPLLLNVALHGLEQAAGVRYLTPGKNTGATKAGSPAVIRYADDLVALCHSQEQAQQVQARLAEWLAPRGLTHRRIFGPRVARSLNATVPSDLLTTGRRTICCKT